MTAAQRVPGRDAHFIYEQRPNQPMHTLKLLVFETAPGSSPQNVERVRETLGPRIRELSPLRRRLQPVPLRLFHPVWVDAGDPDLEHHVRPARVAAPGGERELAQLVAELAILPLEPGLPLWQLWVVEGLEHGRAALVLKLHHAVADGHSSGRVIAHLLGGIDAGEERLGVEPAPSSLRLLIDALPPLAATVLSSGRIIRRGIRAGRASTRLRRSSPARLAGAFTAERMLWNEAPTMRRSFAYVSLPQAELRRVQEVRSCTSAELVGALVAGALRSYLDAHGIAHERGLSASIPFSLRTADQLEWGNHVGTVFIELATELADPLTRLAAITEAISTVRAHRQELDLEQWDELWELYPLTRIAYLASLAITRRTIDRPTFNLIVSSVTGPASPLSLMGAELKAIHSLGVLTEDQGLNITTWSYGDQLSFGVTSCPELIGDVWDLAERIAPALAELVEACARAGSQHSAA
jgi:diacylglycerol O-acyltransferase / wax synthase